MNQLGKPRVRWQNLMAWETKILSRLMMDVEGVTEFARRIIENYFNKLLKVNEAFQFF